MTRPGSAVPFSCIVAAAFALTGTPAAAQTAAPAAPASARASEPLPAARTVIDRHIEAIGGRAAVMAHRSSEARGTLTIPANGMSGTVEMYTAKPNLSLLRISIGGIGEVLEGFDGKTGWSLSPMTGPMLSEGKLLEQKKFDSDFFNELRETSRYESMTTVEKTTFDGRLCYKVVLKKRDGGEDVDYYDVATGLRAGASATRETPMGPITTSQVVADYKKFGDLLQPTTMKLSAMGVDQVFTITSVEYDKVEPSIFEPPAPVKALIK
jgi:hypothetical protein